MYAYLTGSAESKKCKGIKKCVVRKTISFKDYKACVFGGGSSYRSRLMFRSLRHEVKTLEVNKLALSRDDDKRITVNGIIACLGGIAWPRMNLRPPWALWVPCTKNNPNIKWRP